jgi:hypothetical protein
MTPNTSPEMTFASDAVKQVLTLSTGVLTLSFTFHSSFAGSRPSSQETFLYWGWILLLIALFLGVFCLLTLTGAAYSARSSNHWLVRWPWVGQLLTFTAGVVCLVVFALEIV